MDLDSIEAGLPFAKVIRDAVDTCTVLVALIGRQWTTIADEEGSGRLDDPGDYVRLEVQTALARGVRVIPVLVDGARPPREQQLPAGLQELAGLNALELSYGRYEYDAGRLLDLIQGVLAADRKSRAIAEHKARVAAQEEVADREEAAREEMARQAQEKAELTILRERVLSAWKAGDVGHARDLAAALVATAERVLGPEHPDTLDARNTLARRTGEAGDQAEARDQAAALVPVAERVLGPEHPTTLDARSNLARWTGETGNQTAARSEYEELVPMYERVLGPEHSTTLDARSNLARWTGETGNQTAARSEYEELVPMYERVLGPEHPDTLNARSNLAYLTGAAGSSDLARRRYAELAAAAERMFGPEHPITLDARNLGPLNRDS